MNDTALYVIAIIAAILLFKQYMPPQDTAPEPICIVRGEPYAC